MFENFASFFEACKLPNTWSDRSYEYKYWFRSLLQKVGSAIDIDGYPEEWPRSFFNFCLFSVGWVGLFRSERFGAKEANMLAFNPCTIGGRFSFYYQPTTFIVSNPLYTKTFEIHKDGEIVRLTPDAYCGGFGLFDILDFYADKLAECSKGIKMGLINAKIPVIIGANNESQAQKIKAIYDKVMNAETLIVYGEKQNTLGDEVIPSATPFDSWLNDFNHTYIVSQLLQDMKELITQFFQEVGIPVADLTAKKSHLLQDEVDQTKAQTGARLQTMINTMNEDFSWVERTLGYRMEAKAHAESMQDDAVGDGELPEQRERDKAKSK